MMIEKFTIIIKCILRPIYRKIRAKRIQIQQKRKLMMNNPHIPEFTDLIADSDTNKCLKILIIGNSITFKDITTSGWTRACGMAASAVERDYVHLLLEKLKQKLPDYKIWIRFSYLAKFELQPNMELQHCDSLISFVPDITVFQLGENMNLGNNVDFFIEKYTELIKYIKNGRRVSICTLPFFPSLEKNNMIEKVALETDSFIVDLSHLPLLENETMAIYEKNYKGGKSEWKDDGIGMHPGDIGMEKIANQIFLTINAILGQKCDNLTN